MSGLAGGELEFRTPASSERTNLGGDFTAISRSPPHKWSFEQKVVLATLFQFYHVSSLEAKTIFNSLFLNQLPLYKGLSKGAITSMHHQLQRKGPYYTGEWTLIRKAIEEKAGEIGIHLSLKAEQESTPGNNSGFQEKLNTLVSLDSDSRPEIASDFNSGSDSDATLLGDEDEGPDLFTGRETAGRKEVPRLLYRAYSVRSQGKNAVDEFRAGLFINATFIPDAPNPRSDYYRKEAARHILRTHSGPTPFISAHESLLRVYQHATRLGSDSKISVINLHEAIGNDRHARCNNVKSLNLQEYTRETYIGKREWLIWGSTTAIVSTLSLCELKSPFINSKFGDAFLFDIIGQSKNTKQARVQISSNRSYCSFQTGRAISVLANAFRIPCELSNDFIDSIIADWKFWNWSAWMSNHAFLDGFRSGYDGGVSDDPPSKRGFEHFAHSLVDVLFPAGSNIKRGTWSLEDSIEVGMVQSGSLTEQQMPFSQIDPPLSVHPKGYEIIKAESEVEDIFISKPARQQSTHSELKAEQPTKKQQSCRWRAIQGLGEHLFVYEPCESGQSRVGDM